MKKADLTSLEQTLARLPVDLKKYLSNQLLGQINAQADTLIATVKSYPPCPHCGHEHPVKWGRAAVSVPESRVPQNVQFPHGDTLG